MARRKKTTDELPVENVSTNADDNFGLPDLDYKPLDRDQQYSKPSITQEPLVSTAQVESEPVTSPIPEEPARSNLYQTNETYLDPVADQPSILPRIIGIVFVVLLAIAASWYFAVYRPEKQKEKALIEQKRKEAEQLEQDKLAAEQRLLEERRRAEELAAASVKTQEGSIETLSARTSRYYVVAASSIDADLVMDYAKKLSAKGVNCKIIPPYGKVKFSRLTVAEGETFADAQKLANTMKADYGDALWVIKY